MPKSTPTKGRSGKVHPHPPKSPFEIGRQGAKFSPGGHGFEDHGTDQSTWAPNLSKKEK